jgi:hypothetical protein
MANIDPAPSWADIRQLETTDRNLAGQGGILNTQPVSIAARLNLLRDNATALNSAVTGVSSRQDAADSNISSLESQVMDAASVASAAIPSPSPPVNNTSVYFNGSEWTGYTVTPVGRTLMAATTQALQRTAIQAVGLSGNETIAGIKTFSSYSRWNLGTTGSLEFGTPAGAPGLIVRTGPSTDDSESWRTDFRGYIDGRFDLLVNNVKGNATGGARGLSFRLTDVRPSNNNLISLGVAGTAFTNVFTNELTVGGSNAQKLASRRTLDLPITVSATAPASPVTNDIWLDISGSGVVAKKYNGTTWV